MVTPVMGIYNSFQFTPEEEVVAQSFTWLNKMFLQNIRTDYATLRNNLIPNLEQPMEYFLQKAQYDGMISVLTYLIDLTPGQEAEDALDNPHLVDVNNSSSSATS